MTSLWHMHRIGGPENDIVQQGSKGPEMVRIKAGRLWMGSDRSVDGTAGRNEQHCDQVNIGPFDIGKSAESARSLRSPLVGTTGCRS